MSLITGAHLASYELPHVTDLFRYHGASLLGPDELNDEGKQPSNSGSWVCSR